MNKLDYYIELKQKEKICLRVSELKKLNYDYDIIESDLISKKFPLKLINKVMSEQGITKRIVKKKSVIAKIILKVIPKVISNKKQKEKPIKIIEKSKKEIKSESISQKFNFDFRENKRLIIALGMVILFFIALGAFSYFNKSESGNGTCPLVNLEDARKINSLYIEKNTELSYVENDQMIGAYFGKTDCNLINDQTVIKLRSIDLS